MYRYIYIHQTVLRLTRSLLVYTLNSTLHPRPQAPEPSHLRIPFICNSQPISLDRKPWTLDPQPQTLPEQLRVEGWRWGWRLQGGGWRAEG